MKVSFVTCLNLSLVLLLAACANGGKLGTKTKVLLYSINSDLDSLSKADTAFNHLISNYKLQLDGQMNTIISVCEKQMMNGKPESELSNFIADAMLSVGRSFCKQQQLLHSVDIAIINIGGIRTAMPKGEITVRRMYEMLPFKNQLVIIGIKGRDLLVLMNELAKKGGEGVSGVKMGIHENKAVDVLVGEKPIDSETTYHIISIDYLVNGGDGIKAFKKRETYRHLHKLLRTEMINYITENYQKGIPVFAEPDGRIYYVE